MIRKYIDYCTKYDWNETEFVRNNVWSDNYNNILNKNDLDYHKTKFEFINVFIINNSDKYLKNIYGDDYMEIPPESKRISHNIVAWREINERENKK